MATSMSKVSTVRTSFLALVRGGWIFAKRFVTPVPKEWTDPPDLEAYLDDQGFIVRTKWAGENISAYPTVLEDLDTLETHLLPVFLNYNQRAKYYQNAHYFYQQIFIIGAFLTTVLAVISTYFNSRGLNGSVGPLFGAMYDGDNMLLLLSVATTIVSTITGYFTLVSQKGEPRKRWSNYRRLAEDLRMTYFKYLSHQAPYDQLNRIDSLRQNVFEIRQRGRTINA